VTVYGPAKVEQTSEWNPSLFAKNTGFSIENCFPIRAPSPKPLWQRQVALSPSRSALAEQG
jgi:hypothetical protein